ncbi:MAG: hypothetical protein J6D06_07295 [Clostridia bacterium]|nr:hypothetical protein [Clostridia bacterium]
MKKLKDFYGMIGDNEYVIDGVLYKVSSKFAPVNISKIENTISDKAQKYVGSDFAHLTKTQDKNTMNAEYVCLTAGKED